MVVWTNAPLLRGVHHDRKICNENQNFKNLQNPELNFILLLFIQNDAITVETVALAIGWSSLG
jgi:hypothetical protein